MQRFAMLFMIGLNTLVILFHVFVLLEVIPYDIVWAGKLGSAEEMIKMELVSIFINLLLLIVLVIKIKWIKWNIPEKLLNGILWVYIVLFVLNTIGNLFAKTMFEKLVFTPLTLLSAILLWIIVRKDKVEELTN